VQQYRLGDTGAAVAEVQATLLHLDLLPTSVVPAVFDDATDQAVRAFQQRRGVSVDGIVGRETYAALQAARLTLGDRLLSLSGRPYAGDDVAGLQERLLELGFDAGRVDGVFGARTEAALKGFQRDYGLVGAASAARPRCAPSSSSAASWSVAGRMRCARPRYCTAPARRCPARSS